MHEADEEAGEGEDVPDVFFFILLLLLVDEVHPRKAPLCLCDPIALRLRQMRQGVAEAHDRPVKEPQRHFIGAVKVVLVAQPLHRADERLNALRPLRRLVEREDGGWHEARDVLGELCELCNCGC